MTQQEVKNFFTKNYGVTIPPSPPKRSFKTYFICLILFVVPLILLIVFDTMKKKKVQEAKDEINRRRTTYPAMYDKHVADYLKSFDLTKKALKKCGLDESQVSTQNEKSNTKHYFGFTGRVYKNSYWDTYKDVTRTSIMAFSKVFFTNDQLVVYKLTKDFYNNTERESVEEFFYRDVTNIKTDSSEAINSNTKATTSYENLVISTAGGRLELSLTTVDDEVEKNINYMKAQLRNKKQEGSSVEKQIAELTRAMNANNAGQAKPAGDSQSLLDNF